MHDPAEPPGQRVSLGGHLGRVRAGRQHDQVVRQRLLRIPDAVRAGHRRQHTDDRGNPQGATGDPTCLPHIRTPS
nr:hypothetical protein GCM10020092_042080 [Actinoplanes digitatis]